MSYCGWEGTRGRVQVIGYKSSSRTIPTVPDMETPGSPPNLVMLRPLGKGIGSL